MRAFIKACAWLGQIKQALTIYKEDIRNRLEEYHPEK